MKTRTKKLAMLLTGAVALSLGAYALGSQAGDGGALASSSAAAKSATGSSAAQTAKRGHGRLGRRGIFGRDELATRLGVTPAALRDALKAIHTSRTPAQRRTDFIQALATALGKPVDQVTAAVTSVVPDRRGPGAPGDRKAGLTAALAKELGVEAAKVQAGLDKLRADFGPGRRDRDHGGPRTARADAFVNAIAAATGVDAAKVRAALAKLRPGPGDRRGRRDDIRQRLATALQVTPDQLQAALDKVMTDERNAFATQLAQRLSIDVQKVQDVLKDLPRRGRHHG
jgi:hypothetical protein